MNKTELKRKEEFVLLDDLINKYLDIFLENGNIDIEATQLYGDKSRVYNMEVSLYLYCLEIIKRLLKNNLFSFFDCTDENRWLERGMYTTLLQYTSEYLRFKNTILFFREKNPVSILEGYPILEKWFDDFKKKYTDYIYFTFNREWI